ncbi:hypothetical protein BH09GEM1_BH09GEM1_40190 [soil metagenome]
MSSAPDGPYWKRAHRDWRVRAAAVVMAIAMVIFVLTGNLAKRPRVQRPPPTGPITR